ncbi:Protein abnormal spindle [Papilio xuthus]|uniref:Protein abnormal spindle n=1 Tax=Papilio xuthus TaxID=66420 RepID=A0A194QB62_PAPXU|nr:Protein abnormal spindle [Papilio xuthus]
MYFQIDNTPERIKKSRKNENIKKSPPKEECPRLVLAPFSRPPQVVFENVLIGTSCERCLEIVNPLKQIQQLILGRSLPQGLIIDLPDDGLFLEPETCYCLTMVWTPLQPTALRETIRFTNENRGRFDVLVVLKSVMNIKGKGSTKTSKISPGKIKKKAVKKSPVFVTKKRVEAIYKTQRKVDTTVNVAQTIQHRTYEICDKENISNDENCNDPYVSRCPLEFSPDSDLKFDLTEIFGNARKPRKENLPNNTKIYDSQHGNEFDSPMQRNILKPSNRQDLKTFATDIFDNFTFTPLKTMQSKNVTLDKGPKIILSVNSDSEFNDSLDIKYPDKENDTRSIICMTSTQPTNKWLTVDQSAHENEELESPTKSKKIPNTSSPKEITSLNFSINTEISRISDLSFFPQRFSTERKVLPKINNETQELINDTNQNMRLNSDTYTKESPNTFLEYPQMNSEPRYEPFSIRDPKLCRQALFKENQFRESYDRRNGNIFEQNRYSDLRLDRSPPRSLTPPLQSIPEESGIAFHSQSFNKTDNQMTTFTINRTFDKSGVSGLSKQTWSKKSVHCEPELWKVPIPIVKKAAKTKIKTDIDESRTSSKLSNTRSEANKSINQNISLNQVGNVYSQSFTVDPFSSSTYFYDVEAVEKIEQEFKRWLNYILTPPADLDSNVEQKIDFGKAWIENRNKEIPVAPTKEQVSSTYHNSHRLISLRRSARTLLLSPEISQVFVKLNLQIDKKLIAIRNDRNLHLDVGLQKIIMELILSYNPLWLRIGLEAIYGFVIQLKSNNDIEGLTTFIIQRMFKNPLLKNKHSKSSAPNMLLPAYMEAIKKFTLKKFFMLVFFLDQAKQKKLIPHDPCLFRRNAVCKDSREILIRFTRELIAGIGDITKHLRPLGYVVCHKQSYLDEYKYAVHNIALDIRDGVRLTKVMEVILIKNGLLNQLRTPPISRLQKIHNVQVALNALKEANFVIVGDIKATDIADGHREKTLSLLWQLIHVFRAPLFMKAANIIQTWWRKKYAVVLERKKKEQELRDKLNNAASVIQIWWRRIQYNRMVELKMQQLTHATIIIQKYFRRWLYRSRYQKMKRSIQIIEEWYYGIKKIRQAREILKALQMIQAEKRYEAARKIQAYVKGWICRKRYQKTVQKIVLIQSTIRCFIERKQFLRLKKSVSYIQDKYKGKLLMREQMRLLAVKIKSIIIVQSYYKMVKQRRQFLAYKKSVAIIENRYIALLKMREARHDYLILKQTAVKIQSVFRAKKCRSEYVYCRSLVINLQRRVKARQQMLRDRETYLKIKTAVSTIQKHFRAYLKMKKERSAYIMQRNSAIKIQKYYLSYRTAKEMRTKYLRIRQSVIKTQIWYRSVMKMRQQRKEYQHLRNAAIILQRRYRALILMRVCKNDFVKLQKATFVLQTRYRANIQMREEQLKYHKLRTSCLALQKHIRAYLAMKKERAAYILQRNSIVKIQQYFRLYQIAKKERINYIQLRNSVIKIQTWYRSVLTTRRCRNQFTQIKNAALILQRRYRALTTMRVCKNDFVILRNATIALQTQYRAKKARTNYVNLRNSVIKIQAWYRSIIKMRHDRKEFEQLKHAAIILQRRYRALMLMRVCKKDYEKLQYATIVLQKRYRAKRQMREERSEYLRIKTSCIIIQTQIRAYLTMKKERTAYILQRNSAITIQKYFRSYQITKTMKMKYMHLRNSVIKIQIWYRSIMQMREQKKEFEQLKNATITLQRRYRAVLLMRICKNEYTKLLKATNVIQIYYRAKIQMRIERSLYTKLKTSCVIIQRHIRAHLAMKKERNNYIMQRNSATTIQRYFRLYQIAKKERTQYLELRSSVIKIQTWYRSLLEMYRQRENYEQLRKATVILQRRYRALMLMRVCKNEYSKLQKATIIIQTRYRANCQMRKEKSKYVKLRTSCVTIQATLRAYIKGKQDRQAYLIQKESAVKIQNWYRSCKKSREIIHKCYTEYLDYRKKVKIVQSVILMHIQRKRYLEIKQATITIQQRYRLYKLTTLQRQQYLQIRQNIITIQAHVRCYIQRKRFLTFRSAVRFLQVLYRYKKQKELLKQRKVAAAICLQKNIRCHLAKKRYNNVIKCIKLIQELWKGKQITRSIRSEFLKKRQSAIKIQAIIRGFLARKRFEVEKEMLIKQKEEQRRNWAASKIQALFRGHRVRVTNKDSQVEELRTRWRGGALESKQESLKERNEEAMELLRNMSDIESIIRTFRSLELLTEVYPMMYHKNASSVVGHVYVYMAFMNRSISSIEVLKYAAAVLVNLARYKVTGPKIYKRDRIPPILKFMLRFGSSETKLFCIFSTYLWIFSKYEAIKQDLSEFLHIPENHKTLMTIKSNVDRMKRMTNNSKHRFHTPQPFKTMPRIYNHGDSLNHSVANSNCTGRSKIVLPALEPDYGITRMEAPQYFEDSQQAIDCLIKTYNL